MASGTPGTYTSGGWAAIDATNAPGRYQCCIPDAALVAGVGGVKFTFKISGAIDADVNVILDSGATNRIASAIAGLTPTLAADGGVPDWHSLERAALRIRYGWANTLWVGDSQSAANTTPRVLYGIIRTWDVRFAGLHIPHNAAVSAEGYTSLWQGGIGTSTSSEILPGGSSGGVTNNTAIGMTVATLANINNSTPFLYSYLSSLDLYNMLGVPPKNFSDGDWTNRNRLKYAILYAKHGSNDLTDVAVLTRRGSESNLTTSSINLSSAPSGHSRIEYDFPTPTSTAATATRHIWQSGSSGESESGKVFSHTGHLVFIEGAQAGYSHAAIAVGGWSTTDHHSPLNSGDDAAYYDSDGKYTQAQLVTTLGLLRNPNTFVVMIGTNIGSDETGSGSAATYKANVEIILARYRAACEDAGIVDPLFVLIAPWQTGSSSADDANTRAYRDAQAAALYEIAVASPADTAFINLHQIIKRRLGGYSVWQGTMLADHVHPNTTGAATFMGYMWDCIVEAAAAASIAGVAANQSRKLDLAVTQTPALVTTGSLMHRLMNKDGGKTYSQATDSLEAQADAVAAIKAKTDQISSFDFVTAGTRIVAATDSGGVFTAEALANTPSGDSGPTTDKVVIQQDGVQIR